MNNKTWVIAGIVVVAASAGGVWLAQQASHRHELVRKTDESGAVYYTCAMHPEVRQGGPGNCPICGMKLTKREDKPAGDTMQSEREVLYWYDPMVPDQKFDQPGPSPFMDMQLVPKYASAAVAEGAIVEIDPRMAQNLGMRTAPVRAGNFWQRVDATGSVAVDERRIAVVEARAAGWVERLDVRAVGEVVQRGQVLAGVYSPELLAAQEELVLARKLGDTALIEAARRRLSLLGVSASDATGVQRRVAIRAPQDGIVTELMLREGAQIMPGMPLMKLADLSTVWIVVEVPEAQAGWIATGRPAETRLRALPGRTFEGTVDFIYPTLDTQTRTLKVRLAFDNPQGELKPGMYAEVAVFGGARADAMLIPSEAAIRTGTRNIVIVAESAGRYRPVEVVLGPERAGEIVVLSGLKPDQQVVVSGQFLIDSEASLLGAYNRMGAGDGAPMADDTEMKTGAQP